jgi:hypothetical protein
MNIKLLFLQLSLFLVTTASYGAAAGEINPSLSSFKINRMWSYLTTKQEILKTKLALVNNEIVKRKENPAQNPDILLKEQIELEEEIEKVEFRLFAETTPRKVQIEFLRRLNADFQAEQTSDFSNSDMG